MKGKPIVYFSARHTLSPAFRRAMKSLSRHVTIVGENEDPETAYASINDCDVFLLYLHPGFCQKLFLIYELGVALVLRRPIVVIRETDLKFSEISIPNHFYDIKLLIPPSKSGPFQTCNVFGKTYNSPLALGDVLTYGYENSVVFCPELQAKCIALLLDKIFSLSRELGSLLKRRNNSAVNIKLQNSKSMLGVHGYSKQAEYGFSKDKISLLPLNGYENDKLKTNSLLNERKLEKLSSNEKRTSINDTPEISINHLGGQDQHFTDNTSENPFEPVNPVIYEFQDPSQEDADEGLVMSDSSSTCDVTYLNDKTFIASANTSPLPSPIAPREIYYPTALPVYPMELCFPPFQIEKLHFDKHALQIAKADKLPSIVRRRIMRKEL
ncbi:Hypothetical predicted protein [Paramuricea clavata]|uniref:Uncharacterized protein n=1 Tax=Paramuricea clavata TaxID=317549 RepID=A0A6S7HEY4_PARCT|nr:Hypothetical predicted protein [Paramuricea clavata]